jgi:hypothetical protein
MLTLNDNQQLVVPTSVTITITSMDDTVLYTESTLLPPAIPRILNPSTGVYSIILGTETPNTETSNIDRILVTWEVDFGSNDFQSLVQSVRIVSGISMMYMAELRKFLDKAVKNIDLDALNPMIVGYTYDDLYLYLEKGLSMINLYQPSVVFDNIDTYPNTHSWLLTEAALFCGIMAQTLFSIDTDLEAYSDLGGSWTVQHFPKLNGMLSLIGARLDAEVPKMKLQFLNSGGIHYEAGPGFRLGMLLSTSPGGAIFRNLFAT